MGKSERTLANYKALRDLAEFVFRIIQMWIVLALLKFLAQETSSIFAITIMYLATSALPLYSFVSPVQILLDWEKNRGETGTGLHWLAAILSASLATTALSFGDPILDVMNELAHEPGDRAELHPPID